MKENKKDLEKGAEENDAFKKKVNKELESLRTASTRLETDLYATKKEGELSKER